MANKTCEIRVITRIDLSTTGMGCTGTQTIQLERWVKSGKHGKLLAATVRQLSNAAGELVSQLSATSRSGLLADFGYGRPSVRITGYCYSGCSLHDLALWIHEDRELPAEADCLYYGVATGNR